MVTFWPYHMSALGMTAAQIGLVFSIRTVIAVFAQPALTHWAERVGRPMLMLKAALALGFFFAAGLPLVAGFVAFAALVWIKSPWESVTLPLLDAEVVRRCGAEVYGRVRLWGSIGYGVTVAGFGVVVASLSPEVAGGLSIPTFLVLYAAGAIFALSMRPDRRPATPDRNAQRRPIRVSLGLVLFLGATSLHWASVTAFNVFFGLHVRDLGFDTSVVGASVAVAIIAEVVALRFASRLLGPHPERWMVAVYGFGIARWILTAFPLSQGVLIVVQAMHFLSFGIWFAALMVTLGTFAPPERRASVQGIFAACTLAGGALLGSGAGGWLMDRWGGHATFLGAALCEAVATILALAFLAVVRTKVQPHDASS